MITLQVFQQCVLLGFPGKVEINNFVLESDQELGEVLIEHGPFFQVTLKFHEDVVGLS